MAVRGRHRRVQPKRINRTSLTLTAGGAGIAMPLIGANLAGAADLGTWNKVADCESSNNWTVNTGNGYFGGLQFTQSTWEAYGGRAFAPRADLASKDQQIAVAEKVLKGQGPGAWPSCSVEAGLTRGGDAPEINPTAARAPSAPDRSARTDVRDVKPEATPQSRAGKSEMYTVVRGDTLSGIADERRVDGGWQRLYQSNRSAIGDDPDLIIPGQSLSLDASARTAVPRERDRAADRERKQAEKPERRSTERAAPDRGPSASKPVAKKPSAAPETRRESATPKAAPKTAPKAAPKATAPKAEPKPKAAPERRQEKAAPERRQEAVSRGAARTSAEFSAPVTGATGTSYRVSGPHWSKGYHTGVDFPVPTGTSVKSVSRGEIVSAGWAGSYGYQVIIRHSDGRYSQYAHLSAISVRSGQSVVSGQRIGRSGSTGNSTGPHLHFEIRTGPGFGSDIDPLAYLRGGGVRI
ncbi:transglycosylase family protein [Streptomyces uncialis]|uniref:transglycosylase family protein n=1 Tax=Streptomyces uncialis TaxID=1048205 RepID=UPI0033C5088E